MGKLREHESQRNFDRNEKIDARENSKGEKDALGRRLMKQREKLCQLYRAGALDDQKIKITIKRKAAMPVMMNLSGSESMDTEISNLFDSIMPQKTKQVEMSVAEARKELLESECNALINEDKVNSAAIRLAENSGIIFLDEIDKIVASEQSRGADVSRQGVQRDLLPIVEGTTIQTRYGYVKTDHVLFIAAGAFHKNKPSDLMPELQGRFPIRVELKDLTKDDFVRILKEPRHSLLKQYEALMATEGVEVEFLDDAVEELASYAWRVNQTSQNIGARRLYTIMERLLEELSFEAPGIRGARVPINAAYVRQRLDDVAQDEDLSRYIL
ncbi:MAG: ATP-dependent protease ATPase subunit HslU [Planctomycetia bacterium]|nr:ATP-dependent protease ATPase subunit HslU [Planctomycetia bacterium]